MVDIAALASWTRVELVEKARQLGVERPERMTRLELRDEIQRLTGPRGAQEEPRGLLGAARSMLASMVEAGLNMPEAAAVIRGEAGFDVRVKNQPPVATVTLAEIYAAQGHRKRALRMLDDVLAAEPDHEVARELRQRLAAEGEAKPPEPRDTKAQDTWVETTGEEIRTGKPPEVAALAPAEPEPAAPSDDQDRLQGDQDDLSGAQDRTLDDQDRPQGEQDRTQSEQDRLQGDQDRPQGEQDRPQGEQDRLQGDQDDLSGAQDDAPAGSGDVSGEQDRLQSEQDQPQSEQDRLQSEQDDLSGAQDDAPTGSGDVSDDQERLQGDQDRPRSDQDEVQDTRDDLPTDQDASERAPAEHPVAEIPAAAVEHLAADVPAAAAEAAVDPDLGGSTEDALPQDASPQQDAPRQDTALPADTASPEPSAAVPQDPVPLDTVPLGTQNTAQLAQDALFFRTDPEGTQLYWELSPASVDRARRRMPEGHPIVRVVAMQPSVEGTNRVDLDLPVETPTGWTRLQELRPPAIVRAALGWLAPEGFAPLAVGTELDGVYRPPVSADAEAAEQRARERFA
jgi:hypothetical protein